jgi:uncharacterized protein (TIGR03435 family)
MNPPLARAAVACVRGWTRIYTWGMPSAMRDRRRNEIESDLWESQSHVSASHILLRLVRGIPDDLGWRAEQVAVAEILGPGSIALSGRVLGAVLFVSAMWAIDLDASRPRPAAQSPAVPALTFEVISIKPNPAGRAAPTQTRVLPGGQYIMTNMDVRLLIGQAYRVQSYRLLGGPAWIESESFDIVAKASADSPPARGPRAFDAALQKLLAERFRLVVHTETRQLPIYELVFARNDKRPGSSLTRSPRTDCGAVLAQAGPREPGGPPPPPPPSGQAPPCGMVNRIATFDADSVTLIQLANFLSAELNRRVVDRSGLQGLFNVHLAWTPDPLPAGPLDPDLPPIDPNGPSIFTAVQEQLGLKLEPATGPVDVLVIDSVERPTPN